MSLKSTFLCPLLYYPHLATVLWIGFSGVSEGAASANHSSALRYNRILPSFPHFPHSTSFHIIHNRRDFRPILQMGKAKSNHLAKATRPGISGREEANPGFPPAAGFRNLLRSSHLPARAPPPRPTPARGAGPAPGGACLGR